MLLVFGFSVDWWGFSWFKKITTLRNVEKKHQLQHPVISITTSALHGFCMAKYTLVIEPSKGSFRDYPPSWRFRSHFFFQSSSWKFHWRIRGLVDLIRARHMGPLAPLMTLRIVEPLLTFSIVQSVKSIHQYFRSFGAFSELRTISHEDCSNFTFYRGLHLLFLDFFLFLKVFLSFNIKEYSVKLNLQYRIKKQLFFNSRRILNYCIFEKYNFFKKILCCNFYSNYSVAAC